MYKKILVPLDGSQEAEGVLPHLQTELAPGGEVTLLKVISPGRTHSVPGALGGGFVVLGSQMEESERMDAMTYLKGVAQQERVGSARWTYEAIVARSVGEAIVDFARRERVDLIAIYTHDRKGLSRLLRSSTAREVQRSAPMHVNVYTPSDVAAHAPTPAPPAAAVPAASEAGGTERILREADIFRGLSEEQIGEVVPIAQRIHLETGQTLGHEGDLGDHIYIIADGEAQLAAHTDVGDLAARVAGPGECFPLATLVGTGNLITSATALTDMEVLRLPKTPLESLCSQKPEIGLRVYMNIAEVFVGRYGDTLRHLARTVERELQDCS